MGGDLRLAVVAPPGVEKPLPRRRCFRLWPTISTRWGGGGAFLDSVGGGSVEARAPLRVRPQGGLASAQTTWTLCHGGCHSPLCLFPWRLFQSQENVHASIGVCSHPSTTKAPALAPILVVATLAAEPQNSTFLTLG